MYRYTLVLNFMGTCSCYHLINFRCDETITAILSLIKAVDGQVISDNIIQGERKHGTPVTYLERQFSGSSKLHVFEEICFQHSSHYLLDDKYGEVKFKISI